MLDIIKSLTISEKEEIKYIIERNIAEENRKNFYRNYLQSKKELKKGKLKFSSDIRDLKKML